MSHAGSMSDPNEPLDIEVQRDRGVTVTFADGLVSEFSLMDLRLGCPCATCRSLREGNEDVWPRPGNPTPLRITDAQLHGAWALNITWNDGHSTGMFAFESLRRWSEGEAPFGADSGLSG